MLLASLYIKLVQVVIILYGVEFGSRLVPQYSFSSSIVVIDN